MSRSAISLLLFVLFFLAYLCDQRKREDEIQDLKKTHKRWLSHRCHPTASLNIFPWMPLTHSCYRDIWSQASLFCYDIPSLKVLSVLTVGSDMKLGILGKLAQALRRFKAAAWLFVFTELIHMENVYCYCLTNTNAISFLTNLIIMTCMNVIFFKSACDDATKEREFFLLVHFR